VHFDRLIIESGEATFSLDLHPRLTVVNGVGRLEREGLINELVSALGPGRAGVHLEITSDAGARYALFRPVGGRHCVVDVNHEQDVTSAFRGPDGNVNLLAHAGLDQQGAARQLRIGPSDLATSSTQEEYILTLAHVDQGRLWDVANKVRDRQLNLEAAAADAGSNALDAEMVEEIEHRHQLFEDARRKLEDVRRRWSLLGALAAVAALPAAAAIGALVALPLILIAIGTTAVSFRYWMDSEKARRHEQELLDETGAHSYLNFQVRRVNDLVTNDQQRQRLRQAAEYHRAAMVEWTLLAGDVPVDWALEHRSEVRQAAAAARETIGGPRNPMATTLNEIEEATADVSHTLSRRLSAIRDLGDGSETFPVFLDDPFVHLESGSKPALLEQLVAASTRQQLIYLTADPDIAAWARVEALTNEISLIEPGMGPREDAGEDTTRMPRRGPRRHHGSDSVPA
jgi:hypothetical protein